MSSKNLNLVRNKRDTSVIVITTFISYELQLGSGSFLVVYFGGTHEGYGDVGIWQSRSEVCSGIPYHAVTLFYLGVWENHSFVLLKDFVDSVYPILLKYVDFNPVYWQSVWEQLLLSFSKL